MTHSPILVDFSLRLFANIIANETAIYVVIVRTIPDVDNLTAWEEEEVHFIADLKRQGQKLLIGCAQL